MCGWSASMPEWAGAERAGFGPSMGLGEGAPLEAVLRGPGAVVAGQALVEGVALGGR